MAERNRLDITKLTAADATVLDLALGYFTSSVRKNPAVLPTEELREALPKLHRVVLDIKRQDTDTPSEVDELRDGARFLLDTLQTTADTSDDVEMISAQNFARNLLDDWSK